MLAATFVSTLRCYSRLWSSINPVVSFDVNSTLQVAKATPTKIVSCCPSTLLAVGTQVHR